MTNHPTAAERYAGLVAIRDGLGQLIEDAKRDVEVEAQAMRAASWATPFGRVNVTREDPRIALDTDAYVEMVREHFPDEVETVTTYAVNPAFTAGFLADLVIVAGRVVSKSTGEVVDCARITPQGPAKVVYPATRESRDAKALARMLLEERAASLTAGLLEVTA